MERTKSSCTASFFQYSLPEGAGGDGRSFCPGPPGWGRGGNRKRKEEEGRFPGRAGKREFRRWLGSVKQFRESFPGRGSPPACYAVRLWKKQAFRVIDAWTGKGRMTLKTA
ncbi:hypothetical protein HMPREF3038_01067 [Akkermansia sp. KLE1797]|nr:hypothetical protein HMPREF3038_01067 [Akkermansia sp. KLE1797]KXU53428.1 hypothetical protein HMPREF3039_02430 [Akkermansia sp. KLE1798]KZA05033.1 hypothetical protein HMPREF1326_01251 [Akkermansia sp. KLE1605]